MINIFKNKIEEKFSIQDLKIKNQNSLCKCESEKKENIKSNEYRIDESMILQNSKAEVDLWGMSEEKDQTIAHHHRSNKNYIETSQGNSKIFSISPEKESFYFENQNIDEKENIMNGAKK